MSNLLYEPLQNRSRETLHRILEAAETIMANKPFEKITIAEIVKQAKTTTGSFYARFPDKEALLARLFDQHVSEIAEGIDESLAEIATLSPEARIDHIVAIIGNGFRLRPALWRSGTLHLWNKAKGVESLRVSVSKHAELVGKLLDVMEKAATDLHCRRPKTAAHFVVKTVLSASRQHYLFTDESTILKVSNNAFQKEMSKMVFTYLTSGL